MVWSSARTASGIWELARAQHGVVSRRQLLERGLSPRAIEHRLRRGRLHRVVRGVYAVGRPQLTRQGEWMAAILCCRAEAALSHRSAAAFWGVGAESGRLIEISIRHSTGPRHPQLRAYRRPGLRADEMVVLDRIPVTSIVRTLMDYSLLVSTGELEAAIVEADKRGLIDPETLRRRLSAETARRGVGPLKEAIDRRTFRLTDSELERRFLRIVDRARIAQPLTQQQVNGFRVDFFWPDLGLVVETDGLRYHRTPVQQARDQRRDQIHTAAGLTPLRFSHAQVYREPREVAAILRHTSERLRVEGALRARRRPGLKLPACQSSRSG
jgi:very-short-patch-repair endonuclease